MAAAASDPQANELLAAMEKVFDSSSFAAMVRGGGGVCWGGGGGLMGGHGEGLGSSFAAMVRGGFGGRWLCTDDTARPTQPDPRPLVHCLH